MPLFLYKARTRTGERVEGTLDADSRRSAAAQVEHLGYVPVSITETQVTASVPKKTADATAKRHTFHFRAPRAAHMSTRESLTFTTELSDLLASGMNLGHALGALSRRKTGKATDDVVPAVRDAIVRGTSLSDALAAHPASFPNLYVSMVRVGEASGALAEVLKRLVEHFERVQDLKEKVVMALVYPGIVLFLGLCTLIFSMVFVVPRFSVIFKEMGQTLPLPTRMLIGSSHFLLSYGWLLLLLLGAGIYAFRRWRRTPAGRMRSDGWLLRIPMIRGIVATSIFANFARTLSTLLANGVPALQALGIVEKTVSNAVIAREIHTARDRVTDGTTISGPLAAGGVFPPLMTEMLAIGEQTGDMSGALKHIGDRYERELDRNVKIFTAALEPMLIVVVAVLVGFVAVSILMAVFNLTSGLNV